MSKHFLQSKQWQQYEELEGYQTFTEAQSDFSYLAVKHNTKIGPYLNIPYGPALNPKNDTTPPEKCLSKALESLVKLAEEQKCFFIRLEPTYTFSSEIMANAGCVKSTDIDPAHTWLLRLDNKSEEEILKGMESRKVRYWRNAKKKGISLRQTQNPEEITILTTFLKTLGEKDHFNPQTEQHLKNQLKSGFATLYVAELENPEIKAKTPIAAALIYDSEDTRFYMHAATDFEHRNLMAGTIILIQMILDAKKQGQKYYDFWGIAPDDATPDHPWYGFTQYKKSFGGFVRHYTGTYDLPLDKKKYKLYKTLRKINRNIRKKR
ncbi:peptidoglycan bridge formation glycyltransferase FemA/FemB family protein [Candidatus Saccharibacteria bacterium]|nr:peptidoglycan bridge formation glycyltransferase FemA/FemB family protein [Candidatus Saccharibacteria bacterium]